MDWQQLLTRQRLGKDYLEGQESGRTCFQRDFDRLVFSSSFRRLKDKTQVFSLVDNDYIRTRLSHSIEASCVGRSLGRIVGESVVARHEGLREHGFVASDFGDILAAACLSHDIGNPPFGHVGEDAISQAFTIWSQSPIGEAVVSGLTPQQQTDFIAFEGNAQGFSILTRLEMHPRMGGMCLTCPTLAAFMKYPRESFIAAGDRANYQGKSIDKHGFFQADKDAFAMVAQTVGLLPRSDRAHWWVRHPLALLVEAADDICYRIVDIEDGCHMGYLKYAEALELLGAISNTCKPEMGEQPKETLKRLRACAINTLTYEVAEIFLDYETEILCGRFDQALLDFSAHHQTLKAVKQITKTKIFDNPQVLKIRIAAYEVLGTLFQEFITSAFGNSEKGKLLWQILPEQYQSQPVDSAYFKILKITDYIAGMTDSYATSLFQQLKGISLLG
ncbi:MAG: dNTP triphosphohydrolase [Cyanothece sp. SIO2G6]|nr:dNTP triphosphohydrolase [Cyanothece sp. SIO2G6]